MTKPSEPPLHQDLAASPGIKIDLKAVLLHQEIIPFGLILLGLFLLTLWLDLMLHLFSGAWLGRYLGISGSLLICVHAGLHFNAWLPWLMLAWLSLTWPRQMFSPGPVQTAHADWANQCQTRHSLGQAVSAQNCQSCHKQLTDIGLLSTQGHLLRRRVFV